MSILALIGDNEEFFSKKFDCEIGEIAKKVENLQPIDFKKCDIDGFPDPQGKEPEALHFKKQGLQHSLPNYKSQTDDFISNNFWEKKQEEDKDEEEEYDDGIFDIVDEENKLKVEKKQDQGLSPKNKEIKRLNK